MIRFRFLLVALAAAVGPLMVRAADSPALEMARQLNNAFIEIAEKVSPAVVVIKVDQPEQAGSFDEEHPFWDMVPKEFRQRMEEEREKRREQRKRSSGGKPVYNGQGSGIIISDDGYILTNFHVVEDADAIRVDLRDGRKFTATVRGTDPQSDIAVLKINATNVPVAKLGDSAAVRVGEFVAAIGAPFELDYSVTYGHVSAKGRSRIIPAYGPNSQGASMDQDFLQTDASINPGNSGGPLVNLYGEVIGINTLIRGLHTGIGFAIPVNLAHEVAAKLIKDGRFVRSWLGIGIRDLRDDDDSQQATPELHDGVIVTELRPNGPASKSELKPHDIITSVDGRAVGTTAQLRNEIRTKAGTNVLLDVVRLDGKGRPRNLKIKVWPEPWPEAAPKAKKSSTRATAADAGFVAQAITPELRMKYEFDESDGVVVTAITENGLAAGNLQPGDVIVGVNHRPIKTAAEFESALGEADLGKGVLLDFVRRGMKQREVLRRPAE